MPDGMYYELTYNGDKHELYLMLIRNFKTCALTVIVLIKQTIKWETLWKQSFAHVITEDLERKGDANMNVNVT